MSDLEVGAEVTFECEVCGWSLAFEIGGPKADHAETMRCPNTYCGAEYEIRLEVEPQQLPDGSHA